MLEEVVQRGSERAMLVTALVEAAQFEPDVAIVDIGLPDVSGFEVARELRRRFTGRRLFLAAATGWGQPEDRVKALAAGFDHHVLKPADRGKLQSIIELAEQDRRQARPVRGPSGAS